jgi:peptidyl-prolyl cis-trans isomerase B (cyclophilin B)
MAARAEAARRKRLLQARIGAGVAGVLVIAAVVWVTVALTGGDGKPSASSSSGPTTCEWIPTVDPSASPQPSLGPGQKNVGTPPVTVPNTGYQTMTINTNLGLIKVEMDLSKTPCTAASFAHLAAAKFYNNSPCHRLVPTIFALQCGDPGGTGQGGPTYRYANENLPTGRPAYHDGDMAMANADQPEQPSQGTNGSQFFFVYGRGDLPGNYTLFGRVIEGMDIVKQVTAAGFVPGQSPGEGQPKKKLTITSITLAEPTAEPTPTPSASATPA